MKNLVKGGLVTMTLAASNAMAAVSSEITSALTDAKADAVTVAGTVFGVIIAIYAIKLARKAL